MEVLGTPRGQLETAETDRYTDAVEEDENEAEISRSHGRIDDIYTVEVMGDAGFFGKSPTTGCPQDPHRTLS